MILSDREIENALSQCLIFIDPLPDKQQYTTSALDLRFGNELYELTTIEELDSQEPRGAHRPLIIDLANVSTAELFHKYAKPINAEKDGTFILQPNKFVLGLTLEKVYLPEKSKLAARVEGRSTLARLGLVVHFTAPTIHCGFSGRIALEMYNFGCYPLILTPGSLPICQLIFERLGSRPKRKIRTQYQHQKDIR